MFGQCGKECGRRREEALLEQFGHKFGGVLFATIASMSDALLTILLQSLMDIALRLGISHLDGLDVAFGEAWFAIPARWQLGLEATDHDGIQLFWIWLDSTGKALVVQQFEQGREAFAVAIMGCC